MLRSSYLKLYSLRFKHRNEKEPTFNFDIKKATRFFGIDARAYTFGTGEEKMNLKNLGARKRCTRLYRHALHVKKY
jgi:hypothetical protein